MNRTPNMSAFPAGAPGGWPKSLGPGGDRNPLSTGQWHSAPAWRRCADPCHPQATLGFSVAGRYLAFAFGLAVLCFAFAGGCAAAPKGVPWTIMCMELQGPQGAQQIEQIGATLKRTPGIRAKDVFTRSETDGYSRLYYGTYYRRTDPATGKRSVPPQMQQDLEFIKGLGAEGQQYFFRRALLVRKPFPDVGRPEWALANVDAVYSLQVAVFEPTDDFHEYKQAAADYCAELRRRGFEAYYHHGSACSMVTVGAFGEEAVINRNGNHYYSAEVLALQRREELKYNLLNGSPYCPIVGGKRAAPVSSLLVKIPGREPEATPPWER